MRAIYCPAASCTEATNAYLGIRAGPDAVGDLNTYDGGLNSAILRYIGALEAEPETNQTVSLLSLNETDLHVSLASFMYIWHLSDTSYRLERIHERSVRKAIHTISQYLTSVFYQPGNPWPGGADRVISLAAAFVSILPPTSASSLVLYIML